MFEATTNELIVKKKTVPNFILITGVIYIKRVSNLDLKFNISMY